MSLLEWLVCGARINGGELSGVDLGLGGKGGGIS